jgi:hypothetical protein
VEGGIAMAKHIGLLGLLFTGRVERLHMLSSRDFRYASSIGGRATRSPDFSFLVLFLSAAQGFGVVSHSRLRAIKLKLS